MNCPKCGASNRPNAKFCARCRQTLLPAGSLSASPTVRSRSGQICEHCGLQNRPSAKFCSRCGHTFEGSKRSINSATQVSPKPSHKTPWPTHLLYLVGAGVFIFVLLGLIVGIAFVAQSQHQGQSIVAMETRAAPGVTASEPTSIPTAVVAAVNSPTPTPEMVSSPALLPTPTPFPNQILDRALLGTVQIIVPADDFGGPASTGSGSVLTERGHILTNFHILGNPDNGRLFNRQGIIFIAVSPSGLKDLPKVKYIAELVESDRRLDLALLRIIARQDGSDLPPDLGLNPIPIGDSDTVRIGDELSIIGFPGLGGDTVTLTRGSVSGFLPEEGWIKTDAEINPGNSGGTAINREGQLVGIPTQVTLETDNLPGKIGLVRPVNLARPLIDLALNSER